MDERRNTLDQPVEILKCAAQHSLSHIATELPLVRTVHYKVRYNSTQLRFNIFFSNGWRQPTAATNAL